jgi:organic radical activating enzyme
VFGNNPLRKQDLGDGQSLFVQEVFHTVQGEGPLAGKTATFVRLSGCNLACTFCDTDFESGRRLSRSDDLTDLCERRLVVITGGEPLLQNIGPFIALLLDRDHDVQIETAGTVAIPAMQESWWRDAMERDFLTIVCSPKTGKVHPLIQEQCRHWKYIVRHADQFDIADGIPITRTQSSDGRPLKLARPEHLSSTVWMQPCDEHDPEKNQRNLAEAVERVIAYDYRLTVQVHKIAGLP